MAAIMTHEANAMDPIDSGPVMSSPEKVAGRAEIDTSAPFESVKEAATLFGGMGFWKPNSAIVKPFDQVDDDETVEISKVEEEAAQLERDLILKEKETLDVLKELEITKNTIEDLKAKLQNEASEINAALNASSDNIKMNSAAEEPNNKSHESNAIVMELNQAKQNLARSTNDLADVRATVDMYNKKIEKERISLEKTRKRLSSSTSKISSLEEELSRTRQKLRQKEDADFQDNPLNVTVELQKLSFETEQFKKVGEAAKSEVLRALSEIEQTRTRIKTAEIRLVAAKKMKEAARASEAVALAEIKALSNRETENSSAEKIESVTLTFEEYSSLISRAKEAEKARNGRVVDAMSQVDEANLLKTDILRKVEEATEEVKISKKALEEALSRVEEANRGKLAVEEALRNWRSAHGKKRRASAVHNSTKFKNSYPTHLRKESRLLEVNGSNLFDDDELKPVVKVPPSIGQILSRKLLLKEDYENGMQAEKGKVTLGQMLHKPNAAHLREKKAGKENSQEQVPGERKKFGFARISLLVTKQSKKKKKRQA